jgi:hypothetical protein
MKDGKNKILPDTDTVVEAEVIDENQPQTRRGFLVAHPPPGEPTGFIDNAEMLRRFPVSSGTLRNYRESGKLPFVRLGRRVLWHWPSVEQALLRMQRGGAQ